MRRTSGIQFHAQVASVESLNSDGPATSWGNYNHSWEPREWWSRHRVSVFSCQGFLRSINIINIVTRGDVPPNNTVTLTVIFLSLLDYDNRFDLNGSRWGWCANDNFASGGFDACAHLASRCVFCQHVNVAIDVSREETNKGLVLFKINDYKHRFTRGETRQCTQASLLLEQLWDPVLIGGKSATGLVTSWQNFCLYLIHCSLSSSPH